MIEAQRDRVDYTLQADQEHRVVLLTLGKIVTELAALAAYSAVERFIATEGPHAGITDLSGVEKLEVSADFVWRLAGRPPMIPDGMPRIVVAPRTDIYGVSRRFQILRDNKNIYLEVVHTLNEAFQVLGLASPQFRTVALVVCLNMSEEKLQSASALRLRNGTTSRMNASAREEQGHSGRGWQHDAHHVPDHWPLSSAARILELADTRGVDCPILIPEHRLLEVN